VTCPPKNKNGALLYAEVRADPANFYNGWNNRRSAALQPTCGRVPGGIAAEIVEIGFQDYLALVWRNNGDATAVGEK
jgi:hypothetical protein